MSKQFETIVSVARSFKGAVAILTALVLILAGTVVSDVRVGAQGVRKSNDSPRAFYLTPLPYDGSQALNACAAGYHMASMWEIVDPSNLRYETTLGLMREDSGFGPPQVFGGWVRTGGLPRGTVNIIGGANCRAYTSNTPGELGTSVSLPLSWAAQPDSSPIKPWSAVAAGCDAQGVRVWCVQD